MKMHYMIIILISIMILVVGPMVEFILDFADLLTARWP